MKKERSTIIGFFVLFLFLSWSCDKKENVKEPLPVFDPIRAMEAGLSNCYLLKPNASIDIPVQIANVAQPGSIGDNDLLTAELVWTENTNRIASGSNIKSIAVSGVGSSGFVVVVAGSAEGNAVVAVKVNGEIKWSWHIWVSAYDLTLAASQVALPSGAISMSRNLGASLETASNSAGKTYGTMYQWGRKDPFMGSSAKTPATETRIYNATKEVFVDKKQALDTQGKGSNLSLSIQNPLTYYYNEKATGDWYAVHLTEGQNDLWLTKEEKKSVFDPCPEGWRVPKQNDWEGVSIANTTWDASNYGRSLTFVSPANWLPCTGYRNSWNGSFATGTTAVSATNSNGLYWSSTAAGAAYGKALNFGSHQNALHVGQSVSRAAGCAVRCVRQ